MMYETFEHTADLGLRIRARDLDSLFAEAARAMCSAMVANLDVVRPVQEVNLDLEAAAHDELLRDWLAELLYTFHSDHLILCEFRVHVEGTRLKATARGEPVDPDRHQIELELKAVTYHGLKVEQTADGWLAEVIIDI